MKIIYLMIFFFIAMAITVHSNTVDIRSDTIKGYSIDYFDGNYYIVCNNCSSVGVNSGLDKYDRVTGVHTDFGNLYPNGSLPLGFLGAPSFYDDIFPHRVSIGSVYPYALISVRNISLQATEYIYQYSYILNAWQFKSVVSASNTYFRGFDMQDSAFKGNYNAIFYAINSAGFTSLRAFFNTSSNSIALSSVVATSGNSISPVLHRTTLSSSSRIMGGWKKWNLNFSYNSYDNILGIQYKNGWVSSDNNNIIVVSGNNVYYSINGQLTSGNYTSFIENPSCSEINSLTNANFYDIACSNQNDCVIVGQYGVAGAIKPLAFRYSQGVACENIPLNIDDGKPLYSIIYNDDDTEFAFVGNGTMGIIKTVGVLGENATITDTSICVDDTRLCKHPIWVQDPTGYSVYCDTTDFEYCELGCDNVLHDYTDEKDIVFPDSRTCATYTNDQYKFSFNCGIFTDRGILFPSLWGTDPLTIPIDRWKCYLGGEWYIGSYSTQCSDNQVSDYLFDNPSHQVYEEGYCKHSQSVSECYFNGELININGFTQCINSNQYQTCGQYDNDDALELSPIYSCLAGKYCSGNACIDYPTGSEIIEVPALSIVPETNNDIIYNQQTQTVTNNQNALLGIQRFNILFDSPTNIYSSWNCNYKETIIYNWSGTQNTTSYTVGVTSIFQDTIFNIILSGNNTIQYKDLSDNILFDIKINDSGSNSFCVYYYNSSAYKYLVCGSGQPSLNTVYDYNTKTYSLKIIYSNENVYTRPLQEIYSGIPSKIVFTGDGVLSSLSVVQPNVYNPFQTTSRSQWNVCSYTQNGCYKLRAYGLLSNINAYQNFDDITICMDNINGQSANEFNNGSSDFIKPIPIMWRYIIMLIVVIIFFIFPLILAGSEGVIASLALSSIISLTMGIIFDLSLLIPIIYIILSGGIIALLIRKTVSG